MLSSLTFIASLQQQVQPDADISHISKEDIPDITHISETQNITHISETQHDSTKLSKDSGS